MHEAHTDFSMWLGLFFPTHRWCRKNMVAGCSDCVEKERLS